MNETLDNLKINIYTADINQVRQILNSGKCLMRFDEFLEITTKKEVYSQHEFIEETLEETFQNYKELINDLKVAVEDLPIKEVRLEWEVISQEEASKRILKDILYKNIYE